ncbi:MAG: proline dehydrogenase family protein, partial [Candidatus Omnitrophica bacterium]|nr:proline dehydrogenase family protein [Candidatus Omnitrophota bacterium]
MSADAKTTQLDRQKLEERTQDIGRQLFELARREHAHLTTLNRWTKQVMAWCLSDRRLKAQVLRFLDCLPSLRTPQAVVRHLQEAFPVGQLRLPTALQFGVSLSRPGLLTAPAVALVVRQSVEHIARQFIAGATVEEVLRVGRRFAAQGVMTSFDLLGERVVSEQEAQRYAARYAALITALGEGDHDAPSSGPAPSTSLLAHVSMKPSALTDHFDPLSFEDSVERVLGRLLPLAALASRVDAATHRVGITLDMEQYEARDLTLDVAKQLLLHQEWEERLRLGIVVQAYLRDSQEVVTALLEWLTRHRRRLSIRLVKGAYWDSEVAYAKQRGWAVPVYREKWETDRCFERLTTQLLSASPIVRTEIASHNLRSIAYAMAVAEALDLPKEQVEFQLLYGMGEAIQGAIIRVGYPVRIYTPVGELIPGMAYLVRRILENTANESFLRQDLWEEASPDELLKPPIGESSSRVSVSAPSSRDGWPSEPLANFTNRGAREQMAHALEAIQRDLGRDHPLLIGGEEIVTGQWLASLNPAHPAQCIGRVARAGLQETEQAVRIAEQAQPRWGRTPVVERVGVLRRAAQLMRTRRAMLAALEVLEVGKPWREADADVVEAIDYLEYYSEQMLRLSDGIPLAQRPGEANRSLYVPRGVCAVIAPWNFPLAILTGMASAALVAGNVVILKPAEQSPVIASHLARLLHEAGVPTDVVQYVPGLGEEIGRALVCHPAVRLIMFTGSKAVGLSIIQQAATVPPSQRFVKQ